MKSSAVVVLVSLVAAPVLMVACALSSAGGTKVSFALQRTLVTTLAGDVQDLERWWQEAQQPEQHLTRNNVHPESPERSSREVYKDVQDQVREVEQLGWITDKGLWAKWQRDVKKPLVELEREFERRDKTPRLSSAAFQRLRQELQQDLEVGQGNRAIERYKGVAAQTEVMPDDPRYKLRIEVEELVRRAAVQNEFSNMRLEITGVIHTEGGRSGILVEGKTYLVGDWIRDGLKVKSIDRANVEFEYKGQTFARPW